jgi:hypothetical protein
LIESAIDCQIRYPAIPKHLKSNALQLLVDP